jgi:two-component system sensor histidine kinase KdpD
LDPWIGYKAVGYIFLMGILLLSLFVSQGPIFLAAILSALSWDYLFIPPTFQLTIKDPNDTVLVVIYFLTALIVGVLNTRIRQRDLFLYRREQKIEHLYEVMQEIAKSPNLQYLRLKVDAKLKTLFGGEFAILVKGTDNQLIFDSQISIVNEETDCAAALWCYRKGKMAGWSTDTLPSAKAFYLPIKFSKNPLGVLVYYPKDQHSLSIDEVNFLQSVTEQLGIYLERYVFEEHLQSQNYLRQVEKLYNAIFRSLTKGFYAPLEKISSINQKFKQTAHNQEEKALTQEMEQASTKHLSFYLINFVHQ